MNNLDKEYQMLLEYILGNGVEKKDRTGTGTKSIFGWQIRHNMSEGFPLLTTKKMAWKTMVTELLWFLRGDTNIKYLVDNNCHIWDGDAYKNYTQTKVIKTEKGETHISPPGHYNGITQEEFINKIKTDDEFAKKWGELGPIYGKQWRQWNTHKTVVVGHNGNHNEFGTVVIDQIANLINDLKTNPDSRRLMVNAWNVGELDKMVLPPCHYGFQVYTRELSLEERFEIQKKNTLYSGPINFEEQFIKDVCDKNNVPKRAISLMWNQRSVDTFLGLPFNIASYGLLLTMIADEVNMVPDELIGNLGDVHLYNNHIEQAEEQIDREPFELPKVSVRDGIFCSSINDVILENYQSHPAIKAPLSN
jgi:thymidylate synthase